MIFKTSLSLEVMTMKKKVKDKIVKEVIEKKLWKPSFCTSKKKSLPKLFRCDMPFALKIHV